MNDIQRRKKVWWLAACVVLFFSPDVLFNYIEVENSTSWEGRRNCEAEMSTAREQCGVLSCPSKDELQSTVFYAEWQTVLQSALLKSGARNPLILSTA